MLRHLFATLFALILFSSIHTLAAEGLSFGASTGIGSDSNIYEDDSDESDTFYILAPKLVYTQSGYTGTLSYTHKDWGQPENSKQARSDELKTEMAFKGGLGVFASTTTGYFAYDSARKQQEGSDNGYSEGVTKFGIAETLEWTMGQLNLGVNASFDREDTDQSTTDTPPDVLENREYSEDFNLFTLGFSVAIDFNEHVSLKVEPSVSDESYDQSPGRQTDGSGGFGELSEIRGQYAEFIYNELEATLPIKYGNFALTPNVLFGTTNDQAFGAMDNSYLGIGFSAEILFPQANDLKFKVAYATVATDFDNWTADVVGSDFREDDESQLDISAAIKINDVFAFELIHSMYEIESTRDLAVVNYDRNTTLGTLTALF